MIIRAAIVEKILIIPAGARPVFLQFRGIVGCEWVDFTGAGCMGGRFPARAKPGEPRMSV